VADLSDFSDVDAASESDENETDMQKLSFDLFSHMFGPFDQQIK
jgi:hypothetical protein